MKAIAGQPLVAAERRTIAAEASAFKVETQQLDPVFQSREGDQIDGGGHERPAGHLADRLPRAPQRQRVEAENDQLPFGHQHALGFAQQPVRVAREFQRVRHHDQIDALCFERQVQQVAPYRAASGRCGQACRAGGRIRRRCGQRHRAIAGTTRRAARKRVGRAGAARGIEHEAAAGHAVFAQRVELRQAELQRMIAEHVRHHAVELGLFPVKHVAAGWRVGPGGPVYNRSVSHIKECVAYECARVRTGPGV